MMVGGIGMYLRQKRQGNGLTLAELAQRAGITHPTLSRWERGQCLPRLPELEATLKALSLSAQERQEALALLEVPRAVLRLREESLSRHPSEADGLGAAPHGGDLLKALRQRRRWTLEQVAVSLKVQHTTLSRWERGETWPDTEKLQALCYLLGASSD